MKKILVSFVAMMFLFVPMAFGLSIMPGMQMDEGPIGTDPNQSSNKLLTDYLYDTYGLENPLYKADVGNEKSDWLTVESGALMGSYETTFSNSEFDPSDATISWVSGTPFVNAPAYLVVKDGNTSPYWYLFNLTSLDWDGMEDLVLTGFWTGNGAISHVELYGTRSEVPEPATLLLFGAGIAGLALYRRKRS